MRPTNATRHEMRFLPYFVLSSSWSLSRACALVLCLKNLHHCTLTSLDYLLSALPWRYGRGWKCKMAMPSYRRASGNTRGSLNYGARYIIILAQPVIYCSGRGWHRHSTLETIISSRTRLADAASRLAAPSSTASCYKAPHACTSREI